MQILKKCAVCELSNQYFTVSHFWQCHMIDPTVFNFVEFTTKNGIPIVFATSYIILQELDLIFLIHLSTFLCILD